MIIEKFSGSVPSPRLMYRKADAWPLNQPGWKPTAPPPTGQRVRFLELCMPPPFELPLLVEVDGERTEKGRRGRNVG